MTGTDHRRIALTDELAVLLSAAGLSGRQFAGQAGWQASKVSRLLSGQQVVTDADIATWCRVTGADAAETERLRAELRAIRADEARWARQPRAGGHRRLQRDVADDEQSTTRIRAFDLVLIPGLVQTAGYAAALFTVLADLRRIPRDIDAAVKARMDRQRVLHDPDVTIELLTSEVALRHPIGDAAVMAAQLDRLLAIDGLPAVRLGIIPIGVTMPAPALHAFYILDTRVLIETLHSEASTDASDDIAFYNRVADALWQVAAEGRDARAIISQCATDLRESDDSTRR